MTDATATADATHVWRRDDGFQISTDPARLDLDATHRFLSAEAYWSPGVPRDVVEKSVAGSIVFGVYEPGGGQVGMARVVSDRATFAWVCDVFVRDEWRGRGLGKWLMECVAAHPDLQGLRRWMLATRDAHELYRQTGFTDLSDATKFMEKWDPEVYRSAPAAD